MAGNTLVLPVVTVLLLIWTAFTFTVVNLTRAFTAVQSHVFSKSLFQPESPLILVTVPEFCWLLLLPNITETGAFSLCYFY